MSPIQTRHGRSPTCTTHGKLAGRSHGPHQRTWLVSTLATGASPRSSHCSVPMRSLITVTADARYFCIEFDAHLLDQCSPR